MYEKPPLLGITSSHQAGAAHRIHCRQSKQRFRYGIRNSYVNDLYGYARGDEVLLCLAQCLGERVDPAQDFVGHIGGDDFMLVLGGGDWRERLNHLLEDFQGQCRRFYSREHLEAGCFVSHNRQGQREEFPLLSLSIGVVHLTPSACARLNAGQLAGLASEAKRHAKAVPGYSLHILTTD